MLTGVPFLSLRTSLLRPSPEQQQHVLTPAARESAALFRPFLFDTLRCSGTRAEYTSLLRFSGQAVRRGVM